MSGQDGVKEPASNVMEVPSIFQRTINRLFDQAAEMPTEPILCPLSFTPLRYKGEIDFVLYHLLGDYPPHDYNDLQ